MKSYKFLSAVLCIIQSLLCSCSYRLSNKTMKSSNNIYNLLNKFNLNKSGRNKESAEEFTISTEKLILGFLRQEFLKQSETDKDRLFVSKNKFPTIKNNKTYPERSEVTKFSGSFAGKMVMDRLIGLTNRFSTIKNEKTCPERSEVTKFSGSFTEKTVMDRLIGLTNRCSTIKNEKNRNVCVLFTEKNINRLCLYTHCREIQRFLYKNDNLKF